MPDSTEDVSLYSDDATYNEDMGLTADDSLNNQPSVLDEDEPVVTEVVTEDAPVVTDETPAPEQPSEFQQQLINQIQRQNQVLTQQQEQIAQLGERVNTPVVEPVAEPEPEQVNDEWLVKRMAGIEASQAKTQEQVGKFLNMAEVSQNQTLFQIGADNANTELARLIDVNPATKGDEVLAKEVRDDVLKHVGGKLAGLRDANQLGQVTKQQVEDETAIAFKHYAGKYGRLRQDKSIQTITDREAARLRAGDSPGGSRTTDTGRNLNNESLSDKASMFDRRMAELNAGRQ